MFAQWGVCVQMCILFVVSATEVHGWEGLQGQMKGLYPPVLEFEGSSERRKTENLT